MSAKDGRPCKKCGANEWYKSGHCAPCARERSNKWYRDNLEKKRKYSRRWRENNPEKMRKHQRRWVKNNLEKSREHKRRWVKNNPEKMRKQQRRWRKENPEKAIATNHRRRTRKTKAGGSYTAAEWKALCKQYDNRCLCCGKKKRKLEADHVIPVALGGHSDISNIQPLCRSCNSSKGTNTTDHRTKPGVKRWKQPPLFGEASG